VVQQQPPHLKFAALKAEPEELLGVVQAHALGLQQPRGVSGGGGGWVEGVRGVGARRSSGGLYY
jgi:hypothetical protein